MGSAARHDSDRGWTRVRDVGFQTDIADMATELAGRHRTVASVYGQLSEAPQPGRNAGSLSGWR
jgi:hypothetical protein